MSNNGQDGVNGAAGPATSWRNTTSRYGTVSIGLHWLTLILLVAV